MKPVNPSSVAPGRDQSPRSARSDREPNRLSEASRPSNPSNEQFAPTRGVSGGIAGPGFGDGTQTLPQPLLTIDQVAQRLKVSTKTVRRLRIPCVRLGRLVRFHASDVERFLAARRFHA